MEKLTALQKVTLCTVTVATHTHTIIFLLAIKQWGTITTSEAGNQLQTYPLSYASTVYATVINQQTGNASDWADAHITYTSTSQFRWYSGVGTWKYISIGK